MNDVYDLSVDVAIMPVEEVAKLLSVPVSRVHQHVRDGLYLSFKRDKQTVVPADFFDGTVVVKGLQGTIIVLRDGGFTDADILRWLFSVDETLPGTPVASLREGRHKEVKRRAQSMAF